MNSTLEKTLEGLTVGEVQTFHNLAVFPLLDSGINSFGYITLGVALNRGVLKVEEVSEGGSVPEVLVTNTGKDPVLLLDGEELVGAKQNRVLNTTVLLKPQSETVINVSCTEQKRWSYVSREFQDSDVVMARDIRARKSRSVSVSLENSNEYRSNQGEIWDGIDDLCATSGVRSETAAMRDVFDGKKEELHGALDAFPSVSRQRGLVFVMEGAVLGLDLLSQSEAYSKIHEKLLKSYVVDALPRMTRRRRKPSRDTVSRFVAKVSRCCETNFPSVGLGTDYRYQRGAMCGSALIHDDTCVHAAFFSNVTVQAEPDMRGFRQRRGFRSQN